MKYTGLLYGICLGFLFMACKPDFDLNAPYKDVTVVYGILNYQDSIHYVKIYKGFQSHKQGGVYIDAQNKDSIYYYDQIDVVLEEYNNDRRTSRSDIKLGYTHDFDRDTTGYFYSGEAKILYYTSEALSKDYSYKIKIKNKLTGKITEGITPMVGDFRITDPGQQLDITRINGNLAFTPAPNASDSCYEFHVSFCYFEVDNETKKVTTGKITKNLTTIGENYSPNNFGDFTKRYPMTFYDDIAKTLTPNSKVTRYQGSPVGTASQSTCIEFEGWAAGETMLNYLLSNKPSSSFVQVNIIYTNMEVSEGDGLAFGFLSSKVKSTTKRVGILPACEDSLVRGSKTRNLGFRYRSEYKP